MSRRVTVLPQSDVAKICSAKLPVGKTIGDNAREVRQFFQAQLSFARYTQNSNGAFPATAAYWLTNVGPGGKWAQRLGEPYGNWNYGATGRALGLSLEVLQRGAGAAEQLEAVTGRTGGPDTGVGVPWGPAPYGDNPKGFAEVAEGFNAGC
jgi:hypothetical protein